MKTRFIITILLIGSILCVLSACSGGKDEPLSGIYVIADITDDPDGTTFEELSGIYKEMNLEIQDQFYFEFLDNARFSLILFGQEEVDGTFTQDGGVLELNAQGTTTTAEISGKKIIWTYEDGAKLIFEKK